MKLRWVECPRDAWQGFRQFIPTAEKVAYLHRLLAAGFEDLDLTSFVSPRWVPQHRDAEEVLAALPPPEHRRYLAIVANLKGLERARQSPQVTAIGYPFSISETFQQRNTNRSIAETWPLVAELLAERGKLDVVIYLSMGFGNPYDDPWSPELVVDVVGRLREMGVREIALADTYGIASPERIHTTFEAVVRAFGPQDLGVHLHSRPEGTQEKLDAALSLGLSWFEGALGGVGGCPFAGDTLVSNLPSEIALPYLSAKGFELNIDLHQLPALREEALTLMRYA
jgi:hydroxymethylglutaryl-CoA lyase